MAVEYKSFLIPIDMNEQEIRRGKVEQLGTLPATENFIGRLIELTTDGKIYKRNQANDGWDIQANEAYVQAEIATLTGGLAWKDDVVVSTSTADTDIVIATALNVGDTIDGVTLADGDRVLVKNQDSAPEENGIYIAGVTPARAPDMDASADFNAAVVPVQEGGTDTGGTMWRQTAVDPTVGVTAIVFTVLTISVPTATTSVSGISFLASQAETKARSDAAKNVTPAGMVDFNPSYTATFLIAGWAADELTVTGATHGVKASNNMGVTVYDTSGADDVEVEVVVKIDNATGDVTLNSGSAFDGRIVIS